jgi:acetylornithine deacetylase
MPDRMTTEEILARLVAFPTVTGTPTRGMADWIAAYLRGHGIAARLIDDPTDPAQASVFAQIGPDMPDGAILSGHMDVVPVTGQAWTSDPWVLATRDGRLYGRGTCDMKGFLAVVLAMVPDMLAAGLARPIQVFFSHDEEVGCLSAGRMIRALDGEVPKAAMAFVGEPTEMRVVTGHKGIIQLDTLVRGYEVHSSLLHRGVSAVMAAARLVAWQDLMNRTNAAAATADGGSFDPPWTTLHAGVIEGGTALNITARRCRFTTDIRTIPNERLDDWDARFRTECARLQSELRAIRPEAAIEVTQVARVEGCRPEPGGLAEGTARAITGDNASHVVSYGTEAGYFQEAGYSTVVCGPGSIGQAHQADEFIAVSELRAAEDFVRRLLQRLRTS